MTITTVKVKTSTVKEVIDMIETYNCKDYYIGYLMTDGSPKDASGILSIDDEVCIYGYCLGDKPYCDDLLSYKGTEYENKPITIMNEDKYGAIGDTRKVKSIDIVEFTEEESETYGESYIVLK